MGRAPFSSTSSGALVVPAQGSPSSRHRQQKRDWKMLRFRGFLVGAWVPGGGRKGIRGQGHPWGFPKPPHGKKGQVSQVQGFDMGGAGRHPPKPSTAPSTRPSTLPAPPRAGAADTSLWRPPTALCLRASPRTAGDPTVTECGEPGPLWHFPGGSWTPEIVPLSLRRGHRPTRVSDPDGGTSSGEAGITASFPRPQPGRSLIGRLEHAGGERPIRKKCPPPGSVTAAPIGGPRGN